MVLRLHSNLPTHPITELAYQTVSRSYQFGQAKLQIEHLRDVEAAIDLVFDWLKECNLPDAEIEHLAPYFGSIWPSALALAEWVAREGESSRLVGKRVLEVGCGLAVPSFVAAHYGANVVLSDSHPDVPRFLKRNAQLNVGADLYYVHADRDGSIPLSEQFDYVIASDVLYESHHVNVFSAALSIYGTSATKIVVADPGRAWIQSFVQRMNKLGWQENLAAWTVRHNGKDQDIYLLAFERR